jgi:hypothetical protein
MCKGSVKEKANYFYHLIQGDKQSDYLACNSRRMKLAISKMVFFSEVLPKKYQSQFLKELLTHQKKNIKQTSRRAGNADEAYKNVSSDADLKKEDVQI